jgi:penicillin-binding protein 1A
MDLSSASLISWVGKAIVLVMIWGGVILAALIGWYAYDMPDIRQITQPQRRPAITLLADDGTVFKRYGDLAGRYVSIHDVPPQLVHAILAIEDRRFYDHFGIDIFGMIRAMVNNLRAGHVVQGGSTLTQQLAKNLFLTSERTTRRKVQEMLLSFWLERTYSKDQILTAYLNRVYLGGGAYGVDAAADVYFGKPVSALSLRECAILAGLLRAPSRYAPTNNPALALARAKTVLGAMVDAGYITEAESKTAISDIPMPRRKPGAAGDGSYYADWIVDQVGALLEKTPQDIVVLTTLNLKMQRNAESKIDATLAANGEKSGVEEAALVTLSYDGAVRAMVGGRNYASSQFNRATQAMRQPGSSFKPIIYLSAIEQGMSPQEVFVDEPIRIGKWTPGNYDGKYKGPMSARQALVESINTVAVRVMQRVGVSNVIETARALGITSSLGHDLSLALGTNTVTPLELTGVYAALATGGRAITPYGIKEIRGKDGTILFQREEVRYPETVPAQAVATLVDMMQDVVRYGTGRRASLGDRPMAGKTGTSSDYRDAWFVGFTGNYITGVWMGNDDNSSMKKVTGGGLPSSLWHDVMSEIEAPLPATQLAALNNVSQPSVQIFMHDEAAPQQQLLLNSPSQASRRGDDILGNFIRDVTGATENLEIDPSYPQERH